MLDVQWDLSRKGCTERVMCSFQGTSVSFKKSKIQKHTVFSAEFYSTFILLSCVNHPKVGCTTPLKVCILGQTKKWVHVCTVCTVCRLCAQGNLQILVEPFCTRTKLKTGSRVYWHRLQWTITVVRITFIARPRGKCQRILLSWHWG